MSRFKQLLFRDGRGCGNKGETAKRNNRAFLVVQWLRLCCQCRGHWEIGLQGFPDGTNSKESAYSVGDPGLILEDHLERGMVIHPSILAWRIPWTEEPGGLQFIGLQS